MASLDSVRYKIFRAATHLKELEAELHGYFETNPTKVVRQPDGDPDRFIGKLETSAPIPARLPIIIGDCLQNMRSSLDYLVWELVLAAKNSPGKYNMFPVCAKLEAFNNQIRKQRRLEGVSLDAIAEIQALQPFNDGQDFDKTFLWVIDDLCNINKHRRLLVINLTGGQSDIQPVTIDGQDFAPIDFSTLIKASNIGPFPIVPGPQGPGLQVEADIKIVAYMAFNEGAARNLEICSVLGAMLQYINSVVLPRFERFFV